MWFNTKIVGPFMNCFSDNCRYNWMQSSSDTFVLRFILGPPIPKGKANGRIFSIGTSLTLAYFPPYANSVGAERWNIAKANLSEDP
jgi:hypothetical protein